MNPNVRSVLWGCLGIAIATILSVSSLFYFANRYLHPSLGTRPLFHELWPSDANHGPAPDEWRLRVIHRGDDNNFVIADYDRNMLAAVVFERRIPPNSNSTLDRIVEVHPEKYGSVTISVPTERSWKVAIPEKPDTLFLILGASGQVLEFKLKKGGVTDIRLGEDVLPQINGIFNTTETKSIDQYLKQWGKVSHRIERSEDALPQFNEILAPPGPKGTDQNLKHLGIDSHSFEK